MHFLLGIILLFKTTAATPEYYHVRVNQNSMYADEDVVIDVEENYTMTVVSHIHGKGRPSINMHDMAMGYSAFKDVENGICYIEKTQHTLEDMYDAVRRNSQERQSMTMEHFRWNCSGDDIPADQVFDLFGTRVGRFCRNYQTRFVSRVYTARERRSPKDYSHDADGADKEEDDKKSYWCFFCVGFCANEVYQSGNPDVRLNENGGSQRSSTKKEKKNRKNAGKKFELSL